MEIPFRIPTLDGKQIYGYLHRPGIPTTSQAVIIVHGLTGSMNQYALLTVARDLTTAGVPVVRFQQYDDVANARHLHEATPQDHLTDTQTVMKYARNEGYSDLVLAGHSLGGPVAIAAADACVKRLLLWDPTATPAERVKDWTCYDKAHDLYYLDIHTRTVLSKAFLDGAAQFPDMFERLGMLGIPTKIIGAAEGGKLTFCERYFKALNPPSEFVVIPGSGHGFSEEHAAEQLGHESKKWLGVMAD